LIYHHDPQRVNISDAPVGQPQHHLEQADLHPAEVQSLWAVPSPLSFSDSLFLLQDIAHDMSLGDIPQDVGDQPQLLIVEAPESSSAENSTAQNRATPSAVEVHSTFSYFFF
jgi:hypothetical protein